MSTIDEAKINALIAEKMKFDLESEKLKKETEEIKERMKKKWNLVPIIQAVVGGLIAGALIWSFSLEHILKLYDLQEQNKTAIKNREDEIAKLSKIVDESSLKMSVSQNQNNEFQKKIADLSKQLGDLKQTSSKESGEQIAQVEESLKTIAEAASTNSNDQSANIKSLSAIQANISPSAEKSWFPVVSSMYEEPRLRGKLQELKRELKKENIPYELNVYRAHDSSGKAVYAITLGGYLKKDEASKRVNDAKEHKIEPSAYIWSSTLWGDDLSGQYNN